MTLRRKFALVFTSVIVIPFLVAMLVGFLLLHNLRRDEGLRETFPFQKLTAVTVRKSLDGSTHTHLRPHPPSGRYVLTRQSDGVVVESNVDAFSPGSSVDMDTLTAYFGAEMEEGNLGIEFITDDVGQAYILSYPVSYDLDPLISQFRKMKHPMRAIMVLLAAGAVLSAVFINRTARSILLLQEATRRMAEGDMDFRLPERGTDEIGDLTRSFVGMRNRLKEETARRARFLMAVSHDLSTPLTSIEGYVEAIQDGFADGDEEKLRRYLGIVQQKALLLGGRIESLIDFAHMETGEWKLRHEDVELADFLEGIAAMFREDALVAGRRFSYVTDLSPGVVVPMDPSLVTRALENLFSNAVRYTSDSDEIALRAHLEGADGPAVIVVRDHGRGIPEHEVEHIFDPFYRGAAFTKTDGFGIGPSTVHVVITSHGWGIEVASRPGDGTTFTIRIPLSRGCPPPPACSPRRMPLPRCFPRTRPCEEGDPESRFRYSRHRRGHA